MPPALQAARRNAFADRFLREVAADRGLYVVVGVYCLGTVAILKATGNTNLLSYGQYLEKWPLVFGLVMPALLIALEYWWIAARRAVGREAPTRPDFSPQRLARLAAGVLAMQAIGLFMGSFTSIKNALPAWQGGFPHDQPLADVDRWLHAGADPAASLPAWPLPDWLFGLLEANYSQVWFLAVFGALFIVLVSPRAAFLRGRYVGVFLATWVFCGNVLAFAFLSAGPVYFAEVTGDGGRFAVLMDFLSRGEGTATAHYRAYLWQAYEYGRAGLGTGISAFPSVHVAAVFMAALFAFEYRRWLGALALAYVGVVLFSSVLLGWHYAIDGYFSMAVVALIWLASRDKGRKDVAGDRETL